jgi:hypothetical protein
MIEVIEENGEYSVQFDEEGKELLEALAKANLGENPTKEELEAEMTELVLDVINKFSEGSNEKLEG